MNKFLMVVLPLVLLTGCSPEVPNPQPYPYKNQNDCKEWYTIQMKSDLYLTVLQKYHNCLTSRFSGDRQECGEKPQWKDFK